MSYLKSPQPRTLTTMDAINSVIKEAKNNLSTKKRELSTDIEEYRNHENRTVNDIIGVAKEVALMTGVVYELEQELEQLNKPAAKTDGASTIGGRKSRSRKKTNRRR